MPSESITHLAATTNSMALKPTCQHRLFHFPSTGITQFVRNLTDKSGIVYEENSIDRLARAITELSGDDVIQDEVKNLIVALKREGLIPQQALIPLLVAYLEERDSKRHPSPPIISGHKMFDPFGDSDTKGYLRNFHCQRDERRIKEIEHEAFKDNMRAALKMLSEVAELGYTTLLDVHKILFRDLYPWAGQDRQATAPNLIIRKGERLEFAPPFEIQRVFNYALSLASAQPLRRCIGKVIGNLAYSHPFLDGNGRALILFQTELCNRNDIAIAWQDMRKSGYLRALTNEIESPNSGSLDRYLQPFIRSPTQCDQ